MEQMFEYSAEINAIPVIRRDLKNLAIQWAIPDSELRQVILITEELFSNTIRYAFGDGKEHHIQVHISKEDRLITLEIIDDGVPFNPLEYQTDLRSDPAAAFDGGMGLTLIKTFSDSISYSREKEKNHLTIFKTIKSV